MARIWLKNFCDRVSYRRVKSTLALFEVNVCQAMWVDLTIHSRQRDAEGYREQIPVLFELQFNIVSLKRACSHDAHGSGDAYLLE